jgi:DTW domain-containing protein YfiP
MKKSTRIYCPKCHYPLTTCVCAHVTELDCPVKITILQDSSEVGHAKNTVRLLQLAIPSTQVIIVDNETVLPDALFNNSVIVYPREAAIPGESWKKSTELLRQSTDATTSFREHSFRQIILLDGSWRKTHKIWMQHPQLHTIPALTFAQAEATKYRIRKANKPNSMSTLEACTYTLARLYGIDCRSLEELQAAMQQHWERFSHTDK